MTDAQIAFARRFIADRVLLIDGTFETNRLGMITVAAVDSMTNYVCKFLKRLNVVGTANSIYSLARTKPNCSRRQTSDVSRMAEKTYAVQSAIVASHLLSVSGSSLLYTLVPSMPTTVFFRAFFFLELYGERLWEVLQASLDYCYRLRSSKV